MHRRAFLKFLLAAPVIAATVDVEQLLWTPKPMVTVPGFPTLMFHRDAFALVMEHQRRYNYYRSKQVELLALTPKEPFVVDREAGIRMRYVVDYEISQPITRYDLLVGWSGR